LKGRAGIRVIPKKQAYRGRVKTIEIPKAANQVFRDAPFHNKIVKENCDLKTRIKALTSEVERLKDEVLAGDEREHKLVLEILQKGKR